MQVDAVVTKLISRLKNNPDYKWECEYTFRDLFVIMFGRGKQLIRGSFSKIFVKSQGLMFVGTNVVLKHSYLIKAGKNLILEDNVYINALSCNGISIKDNVSVARNCTFICTGVVSKKGKGISIGNNTGINAGTYLSGQGGIEIGDDVIIGPGVKIFSENHNFSDPKIIIKDQGVTRSGVVIKNNCWIGANVTILDGVTVEDGCVIAAGSIVTKSVPSYSVVAGVPAKVLKNRKHAFEREAIINELKNMRYSA